MLVVPPETGGAIVKNALIAIIKLAMDARYSDYEIAMMLREASDAVGQGKFFSWRYL